MATTTDTVPTNYTCPVCTEIHCVSLRAPCQHEFCIDCIYGTINEGPNNNCPMCRTPLPKTLDGFEVAIYSVANMSAGRIDAAFSLVCMAGNVDTVTTWIPHVGDINIPNIYGRNGLHCSCNWGNLPITELLVQHGADVT